jgi:putative transposase
VSEQAKEFPLWAKISTLKKRHKIQVPLHSYPFATTHLHSDEWRLTSFQVIKNYRLKRYELHVVVEKEIQPEITSLAGIDLGLKRLATAVKFNLEGRHNDLLFKKETYKDFFIRMRRLNNRIGKLQRLGKYGVVKKLYRKRRNFAKDFRRKLAQDIAAHLKGSLVVIGYPDNVRKCHYKGSGRRTTRKRVNHWSFSECVALIAMALLKVNGVPLVINEWWTTHRCARCQSRKVDVNDRSFRCRSCGFTADRDLNAALNILIDGLKILTGQQKPKKGKNHHTPIPQVFLQGTGGAVDHPELSMIGCLCSRVGLTQPSVRGE